ncbi:MAG: hypothetical protein COT74_12965 [Bdellovibrionales bacterium CG10_big_fil_rev_8_21_14_0_10_45_34]|nr:MAG: hypothetical protein COT74_12965 [Bdellovibrionales bacterium CG10_big_fil_rev_8_21_14_0_10_45_34]
MGRTQIKNIATGYRRAQKVVRPVLKSLILAAGLLTLTACPDRENEQQQVINPQALNGNWALQSVTCGGQPVGLVSGLNSQQGQQGYDIIGIKQIQNGYVIDSLQDRRSHCSRDFEGQVLQFGAHGSLQLTQTYMTDMCSGNCWASSPVLGCSNGLQGGIQTVPTASNTSLHLDMSGLTLTQTEPNGTICPGLGRIGPEVKIYRRYSY